jgi:hypothetical protein
MKVRLALVNRSLADIEAALPLALHRERADAVNSIVEIGGLLIEAKAQGAGKHGEWLPWLKKHFGRSKSTAQNYMNAARYVAKNPTVGNLKGLSAGAVYWLSKLDQASTSYALKSARPEIETEVLARAKRRWTDEVDCKIIARKYAPRNSGIVDVATNETVTDEARFLGVKWNNLAYDLLRSPIGGANHSPDEDMDAFFIAVQNVLPPHRLLKLIEGLQAIYAAQMASRFE